MRLNKLVKGILIVIIVFIILAIGVNFYIIPNARKSVEQIESCVNKLQVNSSSMELPIRVIENIHTQVEADLENLYNEKLIEAYDVNTKLLISHAEKLLDTSNDLKNHLSGLNVLIRFRHGDHIQKMMMKLVFVEQNALHIIEILSNDDMEALRISPAKTSIGGLSEYTDELIQWESNLMFSIINDITILINVVFFILIFLLSVSSLWVYKYVNFDQRFILNGFKMLDRKKYNFEELPDYYPIFKEETEIYDNIREIFVEEDFTHKVKEIISNAYHIDDLIQRMFEMVSKKIEIDRVGVAFVDYSRQKIIAEYGATKSDKMRIGPGFEVDFSSTSLKKILIDKKTIVMEDLEQAYIENPESVSLRLILEEGMKSNMILPLMMGESVFGFVFFSSMQKNFFQNKHVKLTEKLINEVDGLLIRAYFTKVILSRITSSFSELVDNKDNETGAHIERMVAYSTVVAQGLLDSSPAGYEINDKFVMEIERNASAHDIGKVAIPDSILKKPGSLTSEEWDIMKTHTTVGADIFKSLREGLQVFESEFYKYSEEIARYHHEKWDGTGYPEGLIGEEIPLSARIVAIGDVFDALTSKRYYKEPFSFEESIRIIKESSGSHFDPILVDVFIKNQDKIREIFNKKYVF